MKIDDTVFFIHALVCELGNSKARKTAKGSCQYWKMAAQKMLVLGNSNRLLENCSTTIPALENGSTEILALEKGSTHCCHSKSYQCNF